MTIKIISQANGVGPEHSTHEALVLHAPLFDWHREYVVALPVVIDEKESPAHSHQCPRLPYPLFIPLLADYQRKKSPWRRSNVTGPILRLSQEQ